MLKSSSEKGLEQNSGAEGTKIQTAGSGNTCAGQHCPSKLLGTNALLLKEAPASVIQNKGARERRGLSMNDRHESPPS